MDADYKNKNEHFDAQFFDDVLPSLMFSYQLSPSQNLRASYNMRISRPGICYLNPFTDTNSSTITRVPMRYYGLNISWRFGELKAQVKKAARSINNDDLKSGGSNAGASGGAVTN